MALSKSQKQKLISEFGGSKENTGSIEAQIAILTNEINLISKHVTQNKKDFSTKRGLYKKVSQRKSLLDYLSKKDITKYRDLIKKLGLRS